MDGSSKLLDQLPSYVELASLYGPFFFGVFLVIVSVGLTVSNKNRYMAIFYGICGIAFMGVATWSHIEKSNQIYAYQIRILDIPAGHKIQLRPANEPIYRSNMEQDVETETNKLKLAIVSTRKLSSADSFTIRVQQPVSVIENGNTVSKFLNNDIAIPFNGEPLSVFNLTKITSDDDESESSFRLVDAKIKAATTQTAQKLLSFFLPKAVIAADTKPTSETSSADDSPLIVYYQRETDGAKIGNIITNADVPYQIIQSRFTSPSNSVWIGTEVPDTLVRQIGETLLNQGVDIRYVGYFTKRESKTNVIQIGYSKSKIDDPPLTNDALDTFLEEFSADQNTTKASISALRKTSQKREKVLTEAISRSLKKSIPLK